MSTSNLDPQEVQLAKRLRETRAAFVPLCLRLPLAAPASSTLPAGSLASASSPPRAPPTPAEQAAALLAALPAGEQRVALAILRELPLARLLATCQAHDSARAEPALLPSGEVPRNALACDGRDRERSARAGLLRTWRAWRLLVLGPRPG